MPYLLEDLKVNRVDLVEEGANSAAFIEIFKRKENDVSMTVQEIVAQLKPEHAAIVLKTLDDATAANKNALEELVAKEKEITKLTTDLTAKTAELATANSTVADLQKAAEVAAEEKSKDEGGEKSTSFDEVETFKNMPPEARVALIKLRGEAEAAKLELQKAKDAENHAAAVMRASNLKSIPFPMEELVDIIKSSDERVVGMLEVVNASIDETILREVGKSVEGTAITAQHAWGKIEKMAEAMVTASQGTDTPVAKETAIARVIKDNPALYREYLKGGAN